MRLSFLAYANLLINVLLDSYTSIVIFAAGAGCPNNSHVLTYHFVISEKRKFDDRFHTVPYKFKKQKLDCIHTKSVHVQRVTEQ